MAKLNCQANIAVIAIVAIMAVVVPIVTINDTLIILVIIAIFTVAGATRSILESVAVPQPVVKLPILESIKSILKEFMKWSSLRFISIATMICMETSIKSILITINKSIITRPFIVSR